MLAKYFYRLGVFIAGLIASLLTVSCEKELDFEYHNIAPLPVVEASITQDGASVSVTYTSQMDEPFNLEHVTDANVTIVDLTSGEVDYLEVDADGIFRSVIPGAVGHDYRIDVAINGVTYQSYSRMLPSTEIEQLQFHWIKMPGDDMAALQILIADNPLTVDYYWIRIYRNGEAYMWNIITDRAQVDGILEEVLTTTHRDPEQEDEKQLLVDGDLVTATVTPVGRQMFDYLNALLNNSNGDPQFEGGPCLGYFLAAPVATSSIVYHPAEISYAQ